MTDVEALIERLEKATKPTRELADEVLLACGWRKVPCPVEPGCEQMVCPNGVRYHSLTERGHDASWCPNPLSSIDAALTLVPEGFSWFVTSLGEGDCPFACVTSPLDHDEDGGCKDYSHDGATPAIALCIAALRARQKEG